MTDSPLARLARGLLLAGAALVLVGLVAVAAGGYRLGGGGSGQASPYAIDTLVSIALALYVVAAVAVIVGTFWVGLESRRTKPAPSRQRTLLGIVVLLIAGALLAAAAHHFHWRHQPFSHSTRSRTVGTSSSSAQTQRARSHTHQPRFRVLPFAFVLGGVAAGAVALAVSERRRKRRLPAEVGIADDLAGALDVTLEDLRAEQDPRRAVIAAYARMEHVLAGHGIPRRRFEAPHEYLGRVLADLTHGGRGAARLTELFERARFSEHAIGLPLKAEAIDAVEELQAELAAAELERKALVEAA